MYSQTNLSPYPYIWRTTFSYLIYESREDFACIAAFFRSLDTFCWSRGPISPPNSRQSSSREDFSTNSSFDTRISDIGREYSYLNPPRYRTILKIEYFASSLLYLLYEDMKRFDFALSHADERSLRPSFLTSTQYNI